MKIGIQAEVRRNERRVASSPETVKKLIKLGHEVLIQFGAGSHANFSDELFSKIGAKIVSDDDIFDCDIILTIRTPSKENLKKLKSSSVLIGMLDPYDEENVKLIAKTGVTAFALEAIPRITRAQSMDVLSSQANIAGYKAVLLAANYYQKFLPMLMTAAGTVKAARVLIMGVGVAGLQAIATAKRLGAIIEASDVRPPVKEQVESLGAKFIDVPYLTDEEAEIASGSGGYARPMPPEWMKRQAELVHERAKISDIIITTALIPGKKAPILIAENTVKSMRPGSVIVDMAIEQGGNCSLSVLGENINKYGIHIIGEENLPSLCASDSSALYSRNILDFLMLLLNKDGSLEINKNDEIINSSMICSEYNIILK
mgnify:CR=1 FL=1